MDSQPPNFGKQAPYPSTAASEIMSRNIFQNLLDTRFVKATIQVLDKFPNFDGQLDITDHENRSIGILQVQLKTLAPKDYKNPKYQCEKSFLASCENSVLPVILVAVNQQERVAYWVHMSKALLDDAAKRIRKNSVSVLLPKANFLDSKDPSYIAAWTALVQALQQKVQGYDGLMQENRALAMEVTALSTQVQEQSQQLLISQETTRQYYTAQLESLTVLKKKGRHFAVLQIIEDDTHLFWQDATPENDYKRTVLLALTYMDLNAYDKAGPLLVSLSTHPHQQADTLSLVAIGHLVTGNTRKAATYARSSIAAHPDDPNGYSVLIRLFGERMTNKAKETLLLPDSIAGNILIQLSFARWFEDQNHLTEACAIYEKLGSPPTEDATLAFDIQSYYAISLAQSLEYPELMLKDRSQTANFTKAEKAKGLLSEAIDYFNNTDLLRSRYYLYINRGVLRKLLGEAEASVRDFRRAFELEPSYLPLRYLLINGPADQWGQLMSQADVLPLSPVEKLELVQLQGEHLLAASQPQEALQAMRPFLQRRKTVLGKGNFGYILLSDIYIALGRNKDLSALVKRLQQDQGTSFVYYFLAVRQGNQASTAPGLRALKEKLVTETMNVNFVWARTMTFDLLLRNQDYLLAADVYRPICTITSFADHTRKFLEALFLGGRYKEAEEWLCAFAGTPLDSAFVADLLSGIYDRTKSRNAPISVIQRFLAGHESSLLRVKLALLFTETGDIASAKAQLRGIEGLVPANSVHAFELAQAYMKVGMSRQGLELAYSLLRKEDRFFIVHQNYQLFVGNAAQADRLYTAEGKIVLNSYVRLEREGDSRDFILVEHPTFDKEIGLADIDASELLGGSVGDNVPFQNQRWHVGKVISKYKWLNLVSAAALSGNAEPPREPTANEFRQAMALQNAQTAAVILQALRAGTLMELLAFELQVNLVHFWRTVVDEYAIPILAVASAIEYRVLSSPIGSDEALLFDISTLVTVQETNAWFVVDLLDNRKYIAFSTVRIIDEYLSILQLSVVNGEKTVFGRKNGVPYETVLSVDMQQAEVQRIQSFKNAVLDRFIIIEGEVPEDYHDYLQQFQRLGRCNVDALRIMDQRKMALVTEDATLRIYLSTQGVYPTRSIALLASGLAAAGTIKSDAKNDLIYRLLSRKFYNFPINVSFLLAIYEREGHTVGPVLQRAIDPNINGPANDAMSLLLSLFYSLLRSSPLAQDTNQQAVLDLFKMYFKKHGSLPDKTRFSNNIELDNGLLDEEKIMLNEHLERAYEAIHVGP